MLCCVCVCVCVNKAVNKVSTKMAFEGVQSAWFVVKTMTVDVFDTLTLSFLLDENILGK